MDRVGDGEERIAGIAPGELLQGRYQVVRRISSGGMGAVYEVIHLETKRRRALKVMLPSITADESLRARFKLEATVTADIDSEHIVEIFDAGVDADSGAPFLVMELLKGRDLASMIAEGPIERADVVLLLSQAALALDKTHAAGIVHRDLKPENLFVTYRDDGLPCLKILDFGIAKVVADSAKAAKTTQTVGTPLYMAPEQTTGDGTIGPSADLYALGHIAYAMLAGDAYFATEFEQAGNVIRFMMKAMAGATEPPTARAARHGVELPEGFDAWFAAATAREPLERFDTAAMLVTELAAILDVPRPTLPGLIPARASGSGATPPRAPAGGARSGPVRVALTDSDIADEETEASGDIDVGALPVQQRRSSGSTSSAMLTDPVVIPTSHMGRVALGLAAIVAASIGTYIALRSPSPEPAPAASVGPAAEAPPERVAPSATLAPSARAEPSATVMSASGAASAEAAPSASNVARPPVRAGALAKPPTTASARPAAAPSAKDVAGEYF